ncbi:MAG: hypothetical protein R3D34_01555 [Nitratireductor sp.]
MRARLMNWRVIFGALLVATLSTPAFCASWEDAISANEKRSTQFADKARELNGEFPFLGTAVNELHVKEHSCAILGRMLGKTGLISHLEEPIPEAFLEDVKDPSSKEENAYAYAYSSLSLDNWVVNAKRLLKASEPERVRE